MIAALDRVSDELALGKRRAAMGAAVFERHGTLTIKVKRAFPIHLSNGAPSLRDLEKRYELAGIAGGWRYYYYTVDEASSTLVLQNKNNDADAIAGRRRERTGGRNDPADPKVPKYTWTFTRPSADRIELSGVDEDGRNFHAVLDRRHAAFPIVEGGADASVPPVRSTPGHVASR